MAGPVTHRNAMGYALTNLSGLRMLYQDAITEVGALMKWTLISTVDRMTVMASTKD
jgi:hypothetical protein